MANVITSNVTKVFDGEAKTFSMNAQTEFVDPAIFQWSPHVHGLSGNISRAVTSVETS